MDIREITTDDVPALAALYLSVFNAEPWCDGWSQGAAEERLLRLLSHPDSIGLVAIDAQEPIGFALGYTERWVQGDHFHLKEMCTANSEQRRGIGTRMMDDLKLKLIQVGVQAIYLETSPNSAADAFYRKSGFDLLDLRSMHHKL